MEILKAANVWAKDELISAIFFILFGVIFIAASIGFWQLGKTDVAKAFIYPGLVAGILLLGAGLGFYFNNKTRLSSFETEYKTDSSAFIKSEIARAEKTIGEYQNVAFKVFPCIIAVAALLIVFVDRPIWRAIFITIICFMVVLLILDGNANARMKVYHEKLVIEKTRLDK